VPVAYPLRRGRIILYPERLFGRSAPVGQWAADVATKMWTYTVSEAPKRSGRLAGSVRTFSRRAGPEEVEMGLNIGVHYAGFVLYGTGEWGSGHVIESRKGSKLRVRAGAGYGKKYLWWVHGQQPNNFVGRAMRRVETRHPSINSAVWNDLSKPFGRGGTVL
jgi:hypothetical protein